MQAYELVFLLVVCLAIGFGCGYVLGIRYMTKRQGERIKDLYFKQEALRPKPRPAQSVDAWMEEDRPRARVSHGKIYPRKGRKRS